MATETGFIRDNLEKVFRLCDILQFLNANSTTEEYLSLKGGTAINLTIFNMPRLSVDIDLDFSKECGRDEMLDIRANINENILNFMFAQAYALSPNTKNPHSLDSWVFYFQNSVGNKDNIKIEVNDYLSKLIILTDKETLFVENFNQGIYQPDLLFDDKDIIERIKEHPMAVWRTNGKNASL